MGEPASYRNRADPHTVPSRGGARCGCRWCGLRVSADQISDELARRRMGYGRGKRMAIERDEVEIMGGIRHGFTLGSPVAVLIRNTEWPRWSEEMSPEPAVSRKQVTRPRPGSASPHLPAQHAIFPSPPALPHQRSHFHTRTCPRGPKWFFSSRQCFFVALDRPARKVAASPTGFSRAVFAAATQHRRTSNPRRPIIQVTLVKEVAR